MSTPGQHFSNGGAVKHLQHAQTQGHSTHSQGIANITRQAKGRGACTTCSRNTASQCSLLMCSVQWNLGSAVRGHVVSEEEGHELGHVVCRAVHLTSGSRRKQVDEILLNAINVAVR
jgi:hypothetical protein